ncbi:UvrB/UvrC motif-containing protein [Bacillus sp. FJAT-49736]|uniref:UvrB/UvrC motif-containing protein n=1 Tax=Bacillus sp. FJAT-49736 TaxID=2833582 RepID=UPI001BC9F669|nr:UvrB/UvrC motif-containing protein [Bacillus sp. FJAT-49736]MBS4175742.1 UvrB/UvrC motif-containing protein [Bacillus sp. FJAT-49736]
MICQVCQERPATLHFTKIINGEKTELHYCDICAQEKGEMFMFDGEPGFSINNLLAGLFNYDSTFQQSKQETIPRDNIIQCDHCKMTFKQFLNVGKFGCSHCYETFKDQLTPILKRLHSGNYEHHGKVPKRIGGSIHIKKQIQLFRDQLQTAIMQEEFEEAAEIRDKIRALEAQLQLEGGGEE